jgi:hypothetical protein
MAYLPSAGNDLHFGLDELVERHGGLRFADYSRDAL